MFSARYDDREGLIRVIRTGFLDIAEVGEYRATMQRALAQAERADGDFDILIDTTGGQPLSSDVASHFERIAADIRASSVRRVAFITPGAVNRIQAKRISRPEINPRIRMFKDAGLAKAWIAER